MVLKVIHNLALRHILSYNLAFTKVYPPHTIKSVDTSINTRGTLYVVATPIGNFDDMTARAIKVLSSVDLIYAEDSRETKKLLSHFDINSSILTYNQRNTVQVRDSVFLSLVTGKDVALVTDAGTPGVSDPGGELVSFISQQDPTICIVPVPGASSVTAALSVSGFPGVPFLFIGFFPKKGRTAILQQIKTFDGTVVFFDSPFRIVKTLEILSQELPESTEVFLAREMTKHFETFYRGTFEKVMTDLKNTPIKGEFVCALWVKPKRVKK